MKSVHITNFYHKNSGGISTSYNNLLKAAERHRRLIRLIVPGETESIEDINDFAKIYYVPAKQSPFFDKRYRVIMPWQYMMHDTLVRDILLKEKPDMIEVTDKYTLSLMGAMIRTNNFKMLGRPMLVHFSAERMDDNIKSYLTRSRIGTWFARRVIGNYTLPNFDFHIANSVYTAQEFYDAVSKEKNPRRSDLFFNFCWRAFKAPRVPVEERIFVCPRGVNLQIYGPWRKSDDVRREMREKAGIPSDTVVLFYAGRISPEKNVGLLIEMMKILARDKKSDFRLLIAGAGPSAEKLKEQSNKEIPGKIIQLGHLDKQTLADFYANADVFIHPNPREPFGIAPLEAMASGTPTVAPNAGGILSYANSENAWLVEPTGEKFASAVREIIDDTDLRKRKVEKAVETAKNNAWERSTDRLLATYDKMYADFLNRNELFTDPIESKKFDYRLLSSKG